MKQVKINEIDIALPTDSAQSYIVQMLEELSSMAQTSGLTELSSLLKATVAASKVDLNLETDG